MITMTRRVMFSAAKIDWPRNGETETGNAVLVPQEPETYGHNFVLDVSVTGTINSNTGIIVNIKDIDRIVHERVVGRLDRKLVHNQAPEFCRNAVTSETLAGWIANELKACLPEQTTLIAVRVEETPLVAAEWRATKSDKQDAMKPMETPVLLSTRVYEFAASHRLHSPHLSDEENRELFGKCNYPNGHGHNYVLEVTVAGAPDRRSGRIIDPDTIDEIVNREVVDRYDHRHFNHDIPEFADLIPSTEVVIKMIWERLVGVIPPPVRLHSVLIRETARNIFEYRGEA